MSRIKIYKAEAMPIFSMVLLLSVWWQDIADVAPALVKFGGCALMGAFVSVLMSPSDDIRGSVRKGCAAVILGTVLPQFANMSGVAQLYCYIAAFLIGVGIDIIYPYFRKYIAKLAKKAANDN